MKKWSPATPRDRLDEQVPRPPDLHPFGRYEVLADILVHLACVEEPSGARVLVVGAGDGREALAISARCPKLTAIEPTLGGVTEEARHLVRSGDATDLGFADESFDLVYCYHVLEHIPDYERAISEMHRVLRRGGALYIGVPNKRRLLAYVFVEENSLWQKLSWNLKDWKAKATGRFENHFGAHAGFTSEELGSLLRRCFAEVDEVTREYYLLKWPGNPVARTLSRANFLSRYAWPSVYFVCRK